MKLKPGVTRSLLTYTNKSSVRSTPETNDCYAIDLTLNSNGNQIAALTSPSTIQLFDTTTLQHVSSLSSTSNNFDSNDSSNSIVINSIKFAYISPNTLFASTNKNLVLVWDVRTPQQETFQLNGCADEHKFLSITCNNQDLLVAAGTELKKDENVAVAFWDLRSPINKQLLGYYTESHSDDIIQVEFSRMNSTKLISGSTDGLVCLYDVSKPNEDDALEQVYNANGPIGKCGFAQHNTIYAITASNAFYIWSTVDDNQELLVQGDTDTDILSTDTSSQKPANQTTYHLSSDYATIVDLLADSSIKDLFPSLVQENSTSWPLLMCDHMGKTCVTLISSEQSEPTICPLDSPHSETLRAAVTSRSSLFTCSDDGQLIQWQATSSNNSNKKSTSKKPY